MGIKLVTTRAADLVPWMWGINGLFSVVGSVFAAILAINFGLTMTLNAGLLCYLAVFMVTIFVVWKTIRMQPANA